MGIAERAKAVAERGQKAAEQIFIERVTVTRVERVRNPDSFVWEDEEVPVWSGPCKVQTYEPDAVSVTSAGRPASLQEDRLHVPVTAGPFQIGDIARVDGYERPYRIDGLIRKTFQTAQRLKVTMIANSEVS